jgi:hypothetical protein
VGSVTIVAAPGATAVGSLVIVPPPTFGPFEEGIFEPGIFEEGSLRPWEAIGTLEVDGSTSDAAVPRAGTVQEVGLEVEVSGAAVPLGELLGVEVDRDWSRPTQSWGFSMPLAESAARFGSPYDRVGPGMGKQEVDVFGTYRTATGVHRFPLIRGGIVDNSQRRAGAGAYVEQFSGGDKGARRDRRNVTLVLPAGHGLYRDRIIRDVYALAGETAFRLERMRQAYKEVQLVDSAAPDLPAELAATEGRALYYDRAGALTNPKIGVRGNKPILLTLEEGDLLLIADVESSHPGDVVTDVTLTGTEQVVREPEEACGLETHPPQEVVIFGPYTPWHATYSQGSGCGLTDLDPLLLPLPDDTPISRTRTTIVERCGVVVMEMVEVFGWKRIETARYQYGAAGALNCRGGVFLDADAMVNGSEPAFAQSFERPDILLSRTVTRHFYDKPGFGFTGNHLVTDPEHKLVTGSGTTGYRLGSVTTTDAWRHVRKALKVRVPGTSWEEVDPTNGLLVTGNGEGVAEASESFGRIGKQVEVVDTDAKGYIDSETVYDQGFALRPGNGYQFAGGDTFASQTEVFGLRGWRVNAYLSKAGEAGHKFVSVPYFYDGTTAKAQPGTIEDRDGARPAVDRIQPEGEDAFDPTLFETDEEREAARNARPTESRQIKVRMSAPSLLATHEPREVKTSLSWAENIVDLAEAAAHIILLSCRHAILFTTAANFGLKEGDWIRLRCRANGMQLDHDLEIQAMRASSGPWPQPCVTAFVGAVYPEIAA